MRWRNEIAYHKVSHTSNFEMEELGALVARELEQFLDTCHIDRSRLLGVCIAMAGVTDPEGGHLLYAPTMHLRNVELSGLTRSIPYPTYAPAQCGAVRSDPLHPIPHLCGK